MLPAGTIERVDYEDEKILVSWTKEQIKNAPEFEESIGYDSYRGRLGSYYEEHGGGGCDWD